MKLIRILVLSLIVSLTLGGKSGVTQEKSVVKFRFSFHTDIHLGLNNPEGFTGAAKAFRDAHYKGAEFILTGGDNVDIDILGKDSETAYLLYQKYAQLINDCQIKVYPTIGNHDRFWGCEKDDPLFNEGLFEKYLETKSYYSFNRQGWHFIVLNTSNSVVDEKQLRWLVNDLSKTDDSTPIVVSVHVPFLSVYYPTLEGRYTNADTFSNFKQVWDLFEGKNLKLVLQGHMHLYEEIKVKDVQFITAGAVSGSWWGGPYHGTQEGYLLVSIDENDHFSWEYVDFGWEVGEDKE